MWKCHRLCGWTVFFCVNTSQTIPSGSSRSDAPRIIGLLPGRKSYSRCASARRRLPSAKPDSAMQSTRTNLAGASAPAGPWQVTVMCTSFGHGLHTALVIAIDAAWVVAGRLAAGRVAGTRFGGSVCAAAMVTIAHAITTVRGRINTPRATRSRGLRSVCGNRDIFAGDYSALWRCVQPASRKGRLRRMHWRIVFSSAKSIVSSTERANPAADPPVARQSADCASASSWRRRRRGRPRRRRAGWRRGRRRYASGRRGLT